MARPGAVLEIDRGYPPDPGQLLRERPFAPYSRPLSERSHRRYATVLERGRRPALAPQSFRRAAPHLPPRQGFVERAAFVRLEMREGEVPEPLDRQRLADASRTTGNSFRGPV